MFSAGERLEVCALKEVSKTDLLYVTGKLYAEVP
jgi:hypothetical protein